MQAGPSSFSMTVSGSGATRKTAQAVLVQDVVYLRAGRRWRPSPAAGRGYPALAEQVRQGGSISNLTSLLRSATTLRKAAGPVYQGEAPLTTLAQAPNVGPLYAEMARTIGTDKISFAVRLDRGNLPVKLWLRAQDATKKRSQVLTVLYTNWGHTAPVKAPR